MIIASCSCAFGGSSPAFLTAVGIWRDNGEYDSGCAQEWPLARLSPTLGTFTAGGGPVWAGFASGPFRGKEG